MSRLPALRASAPAISALPSAAVGLDLNRNGRADVIVTGIDLNRDGIPDVLQQRAQPPFAAHRPIATMGLDLNRDGRADIVVSGLDLNRDGIPDVLQQLPCSAPAVAAQMTRMHGGSHVAEPLVLQHTASPPAMTPPWGRRGPVERGASAAGQVVGVIGPQGGHRRGPDHRLIGERVTSCQDVVRPVIQEVVREVPVSKTEMHTIFRETPQVEYIMKEIYVPQVEVQEVFAEVPTVLIHEKILEVPEVFREEIVRQVPIDDYRVVDKHIKLPIYEPVERDVEVPTVVRQECLVEVPEVSCIELVREVPKPITEVVQRPVERPVIQIRERHVEVPFVTVKEQLVAVPEIVYEEMKREVPRYDVQQVPKEILMPVVELRERIVEVPQPEVCENPVEVPEIEYCEVIKQIPKYDIHYIDKKVIRHQVEYIEKLVEIPHIVYEERIIEVPQVERREILRHVPRTCVQTVTKQVPRHVLQVTEHVVDIPTVLEHEHIVEVPQVQTVEHLTEIPVPRTEIIPREVPKIVGIEAQERIEEVPVVIRQEQPVEFLQVQYVDAVTEVIAPQTQIVEKAVPRVVTEAVEVVVEVPQTPLIQERPVPVPQVMNVEAMRQEAMETIQQTMKEVPRVSMEYRERVVEMRQLDLDRGSASPRCPRVPHQVLGGGCSVSMAPGRLTPSQPQQFAAVAPSAAELARDGRQLVQHAAAGEALRTNHRSSSSFTPGISTATFGGSPARSPQPMPALHQPYLVDSRSTSPPRHRAAAAHTVQTPPQMQLSGSSRSACTLPPSLAPQSALSAAQSSLPAPLYGRPTTYTRY